MTWSPSKREDFRRAQLHYADMRALGQWVAAEQAAERAAHRRGQMYLAATVALFLTSGCLMVAVGLLVVEVLS
jgi:hypothetical protein